MPCPTPIHINAPSIHLDAEAAKDAAPSASPLVPTDVIKAFAHLNDALEYAIDAERALDHRNGSDPSVDDWLREAEAAWMAVEKVLAALTAKPAHDASHRALVNMAKRTTRLMSTQSLLDFHTVFDGTRLAAFGRRISGASRLPSRINQMLDECQKHLAAIATLDLYQPVCDPDDLPYALSEMWAEAR
ncbi:hypothetical protein [Roseovarius nanhaiticus]|uniref:hypothetical protein n=1 Tax=Roseovarius nanhaiticus TaxID=573024 RepID=UPI00248FB0FD|nr:hypothetical protein [Roseovarius nanhaiticus]